MTISLILVISAQFLLGFGLITRLRTVSTGFSLLGLSMLTGLGLSAVLPIGIQLSHLPISPTPMFIGLGILAGSSLLLLRGQGNYLRQLFSWKRISFRLFELPFLAFWAYLLVISAWKCAWFPNLPFDTIVGPDLVATFAVREQTLVSSVFTEHMPTVSVFSNQPFYAPFSTMQQVIYLLAADDSGPFPFGKVWLTVVVIAFSVFLYAELRERIHPLLAGLLVTILACSPELFAYTFLVQTDWANAAFFATGVILVQRYLESGQPRTLVASALMLAFACWTRTETIFFVPIGSLLVWLHSPGIPKKSGFLRATAVSIACLVPVVFWNYGFLRGYIPLPPNASLGKVHGFTDNYVGQLANVYATMNEQVVFDDVYWGYAVPIFLVLTAINVFVFRDKRGLSILLWIAGIYIIFGLLIQHIDGANIPFTFRRGFFKLLFLMYYYLGITSLFRWLSDWLYRWEGKQPASNNLFSTGFTG
ncbi:hypothetical protein GCM10028808_48690 [Spirosoma migulaei]